MSFSEIQALALPFPDIDVFIFPPVGPFEIGGMSIGPIGIRWYAMAYIAGILLGWRYLTNLVRSTGLFGKQGAPATALQVDDLILWITLGIIIGGRLGSVIFYTPSILIDEPLRVLRTWEGGMSFHGGVIGVLVATWLFARKNGLDLIRLGDVITPAVPFGLFFGRIANFINSELWGRPTDLPWGVVFPNGGPFSRHPSQLYEAALEGVVLFLVLRWATHRRHLLERRGVVAGIFFAGYALFRILLENFRQPDEGLDNFPFGLTMGILLSVPMGLFGAWLIWQGLKTPPEPAETPAA